MHNVLFVPSKSLFPQCCVSYVIKSHWPPESNSLGGSQSLCQIPRLGNLLWVLELSQQCENILGIILRFVCLCGGSGSWCTQVLFEPSECLVGMGFGLNCSFAPPTILLGLLLCPWTWGIFFLLASKKNGLP